MAINERFEGKGGRFSLRASGERVSSHMTGIRSFENQELSTYKIHDFEIWYQFGYKPLRLNT